MCVCEQKRESVRENVYEREEGTKKEEERKK